MKVSSTWNRVFQAFGTGCFRPWNWVFQALKFLGREAGESSMHTQPGRTAFPFPACRKIFRKPFLFGYLIFSLRQLIAPLQNDEKPSLFFEQDIEQAIANKIKTFTTIFICHFNL